MTNNWLHRVLLAAALAVTGLWLSQAFEEPVQTLAALTLSLIAVIAVFWLSRIQSARRWHRALDAYAERALAQESGYKQRS